MLDLCYEEDSTAEVDFNVVMTGEDAFVEVQGTAEGKPFSRSGMDALMDLAKAGIAQLSERSRQRWRAVSRRSGPRMCRR